MEETNNYEVVNYIDTTQIENLIKKHDENVTESVYSLENIQKQILIEIQTNNELQLKLMQQEQKFSLSIITILLFYVLLYMMGVVKKWIT